MFLFYNFGQCITFIKQQNHHLREDDIEHFERFCKKMFNINSLGRDQNVVFSSLLYMNCYEMTFVKKKITF